MLVEYDASFRPLRRWKGFERVVDVTSFADGSILLVDEAASRITMLGAHHDVQWSEVIKEHPRRVRPLATGGFLVTAESEVIQLRPDRSVEWRLPVTSLRAAAPLPNGNVIVTRNDRNGWLVEMTPAGQTVWQSKPPGWRDESGWHDEKDPLFFPSVSSVDTGPDGAIFTAAFDGREFRWISPDRMQVRAFPGLSHPTDTRIGPGGELIAVSPEEDMVWLRLPDGTTRTFQPELLPLSAHVTRSRTVLVALLWAPERAALRATEQRERGDVPLPWWQLGWPAPILGISLAAFLSFAVRRLKRASSKPASSADQSPLVSDADVQTVPSEHVDPAKRTWIGALLFGVVAMGALSAIRGIEQLEARPAADGLWRWVLGCAAAGIALRLLNTAMGSSGTLCPALQAEASRPSVEPQAPATWTLLALALFASAVGLILLVASVQVEAMAVALWVCAQVLILAATWPPIWGAAKEKKSIPAYLMLASILLGAVATRFWQIGYYPDTIHHDHAQYGQELLNVLRGQWHPLFARAPSVTRAWFVPGAIFLAIFGPAHWVIRLTSAVMGVIVVWGTYLLGAVLFNRRVGLIAALFAAVNHALLLYSRQPFVLDPVAPFVLSIVLVVGGIRQQCQFRCAAAGLLLGWAMLGYHASITYPPVVAAFIFYLACTEPTSLWRRRTSLGWFLVACLVVALPMMVQEARSHHLLHQGESRFVVFNADGSFRWDAGFWWRQLSQSFGGVICFGEHGPWLFSTNRSICMRYGAVLFGVGLAYLLTWWRTPATFLLLGWGMICIFLGGVLLQDPLNYYHVLAVVVPIVLVCAVAVDRFLAPADQCRITALRKVAKVLAVAALGIVCSDHLEASSRAVRRPARADGRVAYNADLRSVTARFIREHPQFRYYLIRPFRDLDIYSDAPTFQFFAADSDLSDISGDLRDAVPVPPVEPAEGAAFIVAPGREGDKDVLRRLYPNGRSEEVETTAREHDFWVYLVDAATIRKIYAKQRGPG